MAKVTISDVAQEAGVALGTVSNALNHPEKVRPETLELVQRAIDKLGYTPNQSARLLAGGTNPVFGLVLNQLNHGPSLQIANGATVEARRCGYGLLIANTEENPDFENRYFSYFAHTQMAGILIQPAPSPDWRVPARTSLLPTAYLCVRSDKPGYFVSADNEAQGRLVAEHTIERGATRIAVIGATDTTLAARRVAGIENVATLRPDICFDFIDQGSGMRAADAYELTLKLIRQDSRQRPDCIIGLTDILATGAIAAAQSAGLRIPDDLLVAGCDGNPLAWSNSTELTTCAPTGYEVGRRGVRCLVEQIEAARQGDETLRDLMSKNHQELVRPFLLVRTSTAGRDGAQPTDVSGINLGTFL